MELALINYKYPLLKYRREPYITLSNLYNIVKQDKYEIGDKVVIKSLEELKESSIFMKKIQKKLQKKLQIKLLQQINIFIDTCRVYRFKELNHYYCLDSVIKGIYKLIDPISANTTSVDTVYQKTSDDIINDNKL